MLRKEGLVQRKNACSNPDGRSKDVDEPVNRPESEDDVDSKETRLTLMEEVLLLGLKEKEASDFHAASALCVGALECKAITVAGSSSGSSFCRKLSQRNLAQRSL
ncbi:hypothetical protein HPB51_010145 [Rhipicephalus microplus]|uniref:Uncharacterized protein n=1 Tax=Rhipicephalus microplus TaxID=6941 RepID=A0A9J6F212_RHIMP|nr:hypothetical protein HPB51_010145 [Rhipicephalus microplus]